MTPENNRGLGCWGWVLFALLVGGCTTLRTGGGFVPAAGEVRLADLMAHRLEIVRHVAWVKFQNGEPISDPKRRSD